MLISTVEKYIIFHDKFTLLTNEWDSEECYSGLPVEI